MFFSAVRLHRFFFRPPANWFHHALEPRGPSPARPAPPASALLGGSPPDLVANPGSRYLGPDSTHSRRRVLLPLFAVQRPRRLHQNVRIAEVCFPLVGHHLRQAPPPVLASADSQPRRQPALATSRPRRTRPPLSGCFLNIMQGRAEGAPGRDRAPLLPVVPRAVWPKSPGSRKWPGC